MQDILMPAGVSSPEETLASGTKTRDLGGTAGTEEMTDAVVQRPGSLA